MRVRLTHYTIWTQYLKSWVVEGSLDGDDWTNIDRQWKTQVFEAGWNTASFAASYPGTHPRFLWSAPSTATEFRFIRLVLVDRNHKDIRQLLLGAVEFFGTLSE
jgi:hypothetical protein